MAGSAVAKRGRFVLFRLSETRFWSQILRSEAVHALAYAGAACGVLLGLAASRTERVIGGRSTSAVDASPTCFHTCADIQMDAIFDQFARVAAALSTSSRLKLIDRLCQGEQTVDELAQAAGLSVSNASRQLRVLAEARLIVARRDPPRVYYRIANDDVTRFWFALRDLARGRLAEIDRAVAELLAATDPLVPMRREELISRLDAGDVLVLDVRPEAEYRAGHLPGALSVPLPELRDRLPELPRDREIVAYCRGPYCLLAAEAVQALRAHGLHAVRMEDGLPEWRAAGLPVETGAAGQVAMHAVR